ncbi:hypothetical protein CsSME_00020013 [Camellia sinensis var. sinensis]
MSAINKGRPLEPELSTLYFSSNTQNTAANKV